jgi:putative ABC transport system permease protein
VLSGTRITVREAISGYGLGMKEQRTKNKEQGKRISFVLGSLLSILGRPLLLSLRNTFRRKGRLALTLSTLTIAGVIFITVISIRQSLQLTLSNIFADYQADIIVDMNRPYRTAVFDDVLRVPGVVGVESWSNYNARRLRADRSESNGFSLFALPAKSAAFNPTVRAGRWLLPEDAHAVVVSSELLRDEPDIKVGDDILLKVEGQKTTLHVVGIANVLSPEMYVNQPFFSRLIGQVGKASQLQVTTERHDQAFQAQVGKAIRAHFKRQGLQVAQVMTIAEWLARIQAIFDIVIALLLIMAVLLAVVGGLGLMGTMSINVIERTREIGVMRAIGASNRAVLQIVMVEGMLVGGLSWCVGVLVALPISKLLSDAVGIALQTPLSYVFSMLGVLLWLGIVVVLAAVASFLPAWSAARVTVRDVLAYE